MCVRVLFFANAPQEYGTFKLASDAGEEQTLATVAARLGLFVKVRRRNLLCGAKCLTGYKFWPMPT